MGFLLLLEISRALPEGPAGHLLLTFHFRPDVGHILTNGKRNKGPRPANNPPAQTEGRKEPKGSAFSNLHFYCGREGKVLREFYWFTYSYNCCSTIYVLGKRRAGRLAAATHARHFGARFTAPLKWPPTTYYYEYNAILQSPYSLLSIKNAPAGYATFPFLDLPTPGPFFLSPT